MARLIIAPFRGFGRAGEMLVRGRVLAEKLITRATDAEPAWRSLLNSYRRFQSDEIPGIGVRGRYRDSVVETVTDEEGYFRIRLEPQLLDEAMIWHEVLLELADGAAGAKTEVLVPPAAAEFGIISDIDDTIVQTNVRSLRGMIRSVVLQNAATRLPFEGVSDLYHALHRERNPIFYVSSSPWNLHDLLADYLDIQKIPRGPLFLQDFGLTREKRIHLPHDVHKLREIQLILDYYPHLPFLLIGDSGQHDPEIYLQVVQGNAGRIRAVVIRDVAPPSRDAEMPKVADAIQAAGSEMVLVSSSEDALAQVRRLGLA